MTAPTSPDLHAVSCPDCSGSGRHYGAHCCGGQGCSSCDRFPCGECEGEGSVRGFETLRGLIVSAERAHEMHLEADGDPLACRVEDCFWCAERQAGHTHDLCASGYEPDCPKCREDGPPDTPFDRDVARDRGHCEFD